MPRFPIDVLQSRRRSNVVWKGNIQSFITSRMIKAKKFRNESLIITSCMGNYTQPNRRWFSPPWDESLHSPTIFSEENSVSIYKKRNKRDHFGRPKLIIVRNIQKHEKTYYQLSFWSWDNACPIFLRPTTFVFL